MPCDLSYMWSIKNKTSNKTKQTSNETKQIHTHRYREQTGGCQRGEVKGQKSVKGNKWCKP